VNEDDLATVLKYLFYRLEDDGTPEYYEVKEILDRV
jgi:hypothetical protein